MFFSPSFFTFFLILKPVSIISAFWKEFSDCSLLLVDNSKTELWGMVVKDERDLGLFERFYITFPEVGVSRSLFPSFYEKKRWKGYCNLVIILLPSKISEGLLAKYYAVIVKGLPGLVKKEEDFFIYVSTNNNLMAQTMSSSLGTRVKHRVGLFIHHEHFEDKEWLGACLFCGERKLYQIAVEKVAEALKRDSSRNLEGVFLRVSTPLSTRWLNEMTLESGEWRAVRGPYKIVLNLLESHLNFSAQYIPSTGGGTGGIINGTWVGTVGDVLYDRADIGHVTAETWSRFRVVASSFPISNEFLVFSTGHPQPFFSWKGVYRPLSQKVWIFFGVSFVLAFLALLLLLVTIVSFSFRSGMKWQIVGFTTQYLVGSLLEQDAASPEVFRKRVQAPSSFTISLRIFTLFWLFYSLIIATAYRSKLVTFLAFPEVEDIPDTFEALSSSHFSIGLQYIKGAAYQVFKNSKNPTYSNIFKRMSLEEDDVGCFLKAAREKNFACISWDSIAEFVKHRNISDSSGRTPVLKSSAKTLNINAGLVTEKRAVFKESMDHNLRWITDTGVIQYIRVLDYRYIRKMRAEWLRNVQRDGSSETFYEFNEEEEEGPRPLSFQHIVGAFYVLGILCGLGVLLAFLELSSKKKMIMKGIRNNNEIELINFYNRKVGK